jgi:hypothetical protein
VFRDLGPGKGSCSLGRHCQALELVRDDHAYRAAHGKFSDTPPFVENDDLFEARRSVPAKHGSPPEPLDWLANTLDRLDRLNPADRPGPADPPEPAPREPSAPARE